MTAETVLSVQGLVKHFPVKRGVIFSKTVGQVRAVDDVSFEIARGETLSLVGESGCGKSTTGRLILKLLAPSGGSVRFKGQEIAGLSGDQMRRMRRHLQIIFQDPYASLNPRMTVGDILLEPMQVHEIGTPKEREERVRELLQVVGLLPEHARRYPHQFSGGQRQRIGIARALTVQPELIVCDEPVSALDVSIQAQVVNLLQDLQKRFGLSYLFIALRLARLRRRISTVQMAERMAVSRDTLNRLEKGDATIALGTYLRALRVLGLDRDLDLVAKDDELGRKLQDLELEPAAPRSSARPRARSKIGHGDA